MSNTLDTKAPEQLAIAIRSCNSYMCDIPKHFTALDEYRHGLTEAEFCRAFKQLSSIITGIYDFLLESPDFIGLTVKDKKTASGRFSHLSTRTV